MADEQGAIPEGIDPAYGVATNIVDRARAIIVKTVAGAAERTTGDRKWLQGIADDVRDGEATDMPSYLVLDCLIAALATPAADRLADTGEGMRGVAPTGASHAWALIHKIAGPVPQTPGESDIKRMSRILREWRQAARKLIHRYNAATPKPPVDAGDMRAAIEAYLAAFDAGTGTVYVEPLMRAAIRNLPDAGEGM